MKHLPFIGFSDVAQDIEVYQDTTNTAKDQENQGGGAI
jgi:hypothetical protein